MENQIKSEVKRDFHTYYFIESHPKSLNDQAKVKIKTKHPSVQPLRKLLEKDFKSINAQEDFIVSVYAGDIIPSLIKEKEIKVVQNIKSFPVKIAQKIQKNKFEGKVNANIEFDTFNHLVQFEPMKKFIGKDIDSPPQLELLPFQYMSLFSEALLLKERKKITDYSFIEFLRSDIEFFKTSGPIPFRLFLMIYEKILYTENLELLSSILNYFNINRIEQPKNLEELYN